MSNLTRQRVASRRAGIVLGTAVLTLIAACGGGVEHKGGTPGPKPPPATTITVVAGLPNAPGANIDGPGSTARFNNPVGIAVDARGNIFVADQLNFTIRKIDPSRQVVTLAGTPGTSGRNDGSGTGASFTFPTGLTLDPDGNLLVADQLAIRKVTPTGVISTSIPPPPGSNLIDGLSLPNFELGGVATSASRAIYDTYRLGTRRTTTAGTNTIEGLPIPQNGTLTSAGTSFLVPRGIAADSNGNVYVADLRGGAINRFAADGARTTFAGTPGATGATDGTGTAARFSGQIVGLAIDEAGNIFAADAGNGTIRKITPAGVVTTLAGSSGSSVSLPPGAPSGPLSPLGGIAVDQDGVVFTTSGNAVVKVTPPQ
jgi:streptogramin lyase